MEIELSERDFNRARELLRRFSGIALAETKRALVQGRLAPRMRALNLGLDGYLQRVEDEAAERESFINALTTNVTDFFRERHHFEALQSEILPRLYAARRDTRRIRIWSAGCSSGEEPYTIAMTVRATPPPAGFDLKILATDLDSSIVARAAAGSYPLARLEGMPLAERQRSFQAPVQGLARVVPELKAMISFKQLNLMDPWPIKSAADVIFCRNVMIYFDEDTRRKLVDRFVSLLAPDGVLLLGHSESMMGIHPQLSPLGKTIFAKKGAHAKAA